jgi:hypothetical protein
MTGSPKWPSRAEIEKAIERLQIDGSAACRLVAVWLKAGMSHTMKENSSEAEDHRDPDASR